MLKTLHTDMKNRPLDREDNYLEDLVIKPQCAAIPIVAFIQILQNITALCILQIGSGQLIRTVERKIFSRLQMRFMSWHRKAINTVQLTIHFLLTSILSLVFIGLLLIGLIPLFLASIYVLFRLTSALKPCFEIWKSRYIIKNSSIELQQLKILHNQNGRSFLFDKILTTYSLNNINEPQVQRSDLYQVLDKSLIWCNKEPLFIGDVKFTARVYSRMQYDFNVVLRGVPNAELVRDEIIRRMPSKPSIF